MRLKGVNLQEEMESLRNKRTSEEEVMAEVRALFQAEEEKEADILERLQQGIPTDGNDFTIDALEPNRIFHLSDIRAICIIYRLRFLNTKYFKAELPIEALLQIKNMERLHKTKLEGFKIVAPASHFRLENADDPLLFAPIGNDYYYLIHKWGKDLSPLRKILMWPLKNIENLAIFTLVFSFLFTFVIREVFFYQYQSLSEFMMLLLFTIKSMVGLLIFYGIALGKNFSNAVWRSKYYNA